MKFSLERNESYARVRSGRYAHVRLRTQTRLNASDGAASFLAPAPPRYDPAGGFPDGNWVLATGGEPDVNNTVAQMSAMCWHFAEAMTDLEASTLGPGEAPTPLGLVHSSWGGTIIEMWLPNATLYDDARGCRNTTGGPPYQRADIANGALYNGMVLPWANYSVKAVLWYQGENDVFLCAADDDGELGGPNACGVAEDRTGYACNVKLLVDSWRALWNDPTLPFGIVELAGGTSEGHQASMGAFRHAQTAGCGRLPCERMPNVFRALGHDVGDPWSGSEARCNEPYAPYACQRQDNGPNDTPFTHFFMGSIHPRTKKWIGDRLAAAYVALDSDALGSGPILQGCSVSVDAATLTLEFSVADLGDDDGVRVWPSPEPSDGPTTALQVQYAADQSWRPAALTPQDPFKHGNRSTAYANAVVQLDTGAGAVTRIRYAWADSPFCVVDNAIEPCVPNAGPIMLAKRRLPALPFWADVHGGACTYVSTAGL